MSVHYKFKSALEYDTVTFDGLHISIKDLKKAILHQKKIGKTSDFDLQITNAQTKETYEDENTLIPKNTSLVVARVPLTVQQRKQWERDNQVVGIRGNDVTEGNGLARVDLSALDLSEEDKIKTMMSQSTSDYDPSKYVKVRGGNQVGKVPDTYLCYKCHKKGHWIKDCPATTSSENMGSMEIIKKSTGIPRSFMIEVDGPQVPGARMTPSGAYAVPVIDHEVYKEKKIEKPPFLSEKEKPAATASIPEDLVCGICKDLLQDAVMVPCCGISFCDECIRNILVDSDESECPDCNEKDVSPDTLIPNRFLRNSVNNFKNKTGYVKRPPVAKQPTPPRPSLPDFVLPSERLQQQQQEQQQQQQQQQQQSPAESPGKEAKDGDTKAPDVAPAKAAKSKQSGVDDDMSSVSSAASEEASSDKTPAVPDAAVGSAPGPIPLLTGPSYTIPSLFAGQITQPPPNHSQYLPPQSGQGEDRSGTPTVDERPQTIPTIRPSFDYRSRPPPGYPPFEQYHRPPPLLDTNTMYGARYSRYSRPRNMRGGTYGMRQPASGTCSLIAPGLDDEAAYAAFQQMLKEKDERDKRKAERLKDRRSGSRSRSRSRRSVSGPRSRTRSRSRTPPRRSRSRSHRPHKRSRSRSFLMSRSRSRSRSYTRSPLQERNFSPRKHPSPPRSPLRYGPPDYQAEPYGHWSHHDRRGAPRGGRRYLKSRSPPPGSRYRQDQIRYTRYHDENFSRSPPREGFVGSPGHYFEARHSPRWNDYPRVSHDRDYIREMDRTVRRRSRSVSPGRAKYNERERDGSPGRGRRSASRKLSPLHSREGRSRDKSMERKDMEWGRVEDGRRHRSRERRSPERSKDKRKHSRERSQESSRKRERSKGRSRSRGNTRQDKHEIRQHRRKSRSRERGKRSTSAARKRRSGSGSAARKRRSGSGSAARKRRSGSGSAARKRRSGSGSAARKRRSGSGSAAIKRRSGSRQRIIPSDADRESSLKALKEEIVATREITLHLPQIERPILIHEPIEEKEQHFEVEPSLVTGNKEDDKKDKKKDKEKKKKKKERETEEERVARRKRKREKKEEKKRKQDLKTTGPVEVETKQAASRSEHSPAQASQAVQHDTKTEAEIEGGESGGAPATEEKISPAPIKATPTWEGEFSEEATTLQPQQSEGDVEDGEIRQTDVVDVRGEELEIHASYESLVEESGGGVLAPLPAISKWELDDSQATDARDMESRDRGKDSSCKVTSEVIKRAENVFFKFRGEAQKKAMPGASEIKRERKITLLIPGTKRTEEEKIRRSGHDEGMHLVRNDDADKSKRNEEGEKMRRLEEGEKTRRNEEVKVKRGEEREKIRFEEGERVRRIEEIKRTEEGERIRRNEEVKRNEEGERMRRNEEVKRTEEGERMRRNEEVKRNEEGERMRRNEEVKRTEEGERKRRNEEIKKSEEVEKTRRVVLQREKTRVQRGAIELKKQKADGRSTLKTLQITIPSTDRSDQREVGFTARNVAKKDDGPKKSPSGVRVSVKDRLGSKVERAETVPEHVPRSTIASAVEPKKSLIDESHFVPNYDETSDEDDHVHQRDLKKRQRSSTESSDESSCKSKKHKKKKSKKKNKKIRKTKKKVSESSDSSESGQSRRKHKKSKKKKKRKH